MREMYETEEDYRAQGGGRCMTQKKTIGRKDEGDV